VEYALGDDFSVSKVFNYNAFEQSRRDIRVPDPFGVDRDNRARTAHAEAWCFGSLYAGWPEQEPFALQKRREPRVQGPATVLGRAKAAGTHEHVPGVGLHLRRGCHG
jgi:hypothetical protein